MQCHVFVPFDKLNAIHVADGKLYSRFERYHFINLTYSGVNKEI